MMVNRKSLVAMILMMLCSATFVNAQAKRPEGVKVARKDAKQGIEKPFKPGENLKENFRGQMPPQGQPMERRGKMPKNVILAEAHRNMAQVLEAEGKIDEAAKELYKIIDLLKAGNPEAKEEENNKRKERQMRSIFPVYEHIARLYLKNNKLDEAKKTLTDAIPLHKADYPEEVSRLKLFLSEIYQKNNEFDKAKEVLNEVIKANSN